MSQGFLFACRSDDPSLKRGGDALAANYEYDR